jgi:alpha-amylase/alpha-mannosidase (GH57 family)
MESLIIHGHFYQPPRENPWTGAIDREESASPFHDWNERIHAECYRANGFARIVDQHGYVERIIDNYVNLSFNFGPTVLSWLQRTHPVTYTRIQDADRRSIALRHGHGNAIAQGYNHAILPLCNERDRITQVRWGIADFRHRFGRMPEAMWLPETACNNATLETLIDAGMRFVILAPNQADRVRPLDGDWRDVSDGSIDPRVPYRYLHRDRSGRSIAIFFYDGALARAIAFEGALASSENLIERVAAARGPDGELVNVATDGESYGHHFHFGDRSIAYALEVLAQRRGLLVTNYGEYLARNPPAYEVEIKPGPNGEGTSWSCIHGVGRWYRDCGCSTGGGEGWNQAWRQPLRHALDLVRDRAAAIFQDAGGDLFDDPWEVRNHYIELILDPDADRAGFLSRSERRRLNDTQRARALDLLEMQRVAMLMYTSCGWFFNDIAGIETLQVLKYAARAMDFVEDIGVSAPVGEFLDILALAQSNQAGLGNGADVFRRLVEPARAHPRRIAAHLAITALAGRQWEQGEIGDYSYHRADYGQRGDGRLTLDTCRLLLTTRTTRRRYDYAAAALHLGGLDVYCALQADPGPERFRHCAQRLWEHFQTASLPALLRIIQAEFGPEEFGLEDILPDGRWEIYQMAYGDVSEELAGELARLYERNHRRIVEMLDKTGFELPPELRIITEFTLGRRLQDEIQRQNRSLNPESYREAIAIAEDIERHRYNIDRRPSNELFSSIIAEAVSRAVSGLRPDHIRQALEAVELAKRLGLSPNFDPAQEMVYEVLAQRRPGHERLNELATALRVSSAIVTSA